MKTYKDIITSDAFGKVALAAKLKDNGFGTSEREEELESQKKEMEERHAKADAEMEERNVAWKAKYGKKLKESFGIDQEHTSAGTSLNQVSSGIKHAVKSGLIKPHSINIDNGGGKYDLGKQHVESNVEGAHLDVHDPFNRSEEHNAAVKEKASGNADYTGMHNVLNVIKDPEHRIAALEQVKSFMKPSTGIAHLSVYEGDKSENGRITKEDKGNGSSWQNHRNTESYIPEIKKVFPEETHEVTRNGKNIIIKQR